MSLSDYTGVTVLEEINSKIISSLYSGKEVPTLALDQRRIYYPNHFFVLKNGSQSVICRVKKEILYPINYKISLYGAKARNKEQMMLLDVLLDEKVKLQLILGAAGTGKTFLTVAYALDALLERKEYQRLIFTRPMSQVGKDRIGALPGDVKDKFDPYLINFRNNLEQLMSKSSVNYLNQLEEAEQIQYLPMQLMRGASFNNTLVIADEVQICSRHEIKMLGTRIGYCSKLILMGDLDQRDEKIARESTGLHALMHSKTIKESEICAGIELIKNERSQLSQLIAQAL